jgi:hypothetical protein
MQRPRNPVRRSRNIGTPKQGHGQNNELVIPNPSADHRVYVERLRNPREYAFSAHGSNRVALVEEPARGWGYGCTVLDIAKLVSLLPPADVDGLDLFLFRQPTAKQRILESVWGRFLYYAEPGKYHGSAICFEAQQLVPLKWSRSVTPELKRELLRLESDGHRIVASKRSFEIHMTPESLRNTTLFRTALHEIGHYVDWQESVLRVASTSDRDAEAASRAFRSKTSSMKEDFAHRYAATIAAKLRSLGQLPFTSQWEDREMASSGVARAWFLPELPIPERSRGDIGDMGEAAEHAVEADGAPPLDLHRP